MRILLITDSSLVDSVQPALEEDGLSVEVVDALDRADFKLSTRTYEAVLLDLKQVRSENCSQLLRWRREGIAAHVLVVLPRSNRATDRAACLDAGADACFCHPLNLDELRAHLRALRRREIQQSVPVRRIHDLEINTAIRSVSRAGRSIHLTPREFDLLQLLATHPGKVMSRSVILEHLYDNGGNAYSNVIDVYVRYLRNKIDKGFTKPLILTRWGQGYLLRPEEA
jgi:DNA-binding response OmpR family regulator